MAIEYRIFCRYCDSVSDAMVRYADASAEDKRKVEKAALEWERRTSGLKLIDMDNRLTESNGWASFIICTLTSMGIRATETEDEGSPLLGAAKVDDTAGKMDRRTLRELMDIASVNACEDGMFEVMLDLGLSLMVHTDGCADANAEDLRDEVAAHATETEDDSGIVYRVVDGLPRRTYRQYFKYCAYAEFEAESDDAARFIGPLMSPTSRFWCERKGSLDRRDDNGRYEETIEEGE